DIGVQAHFGPCIARAAWLDPAAELRALYGVEDHRLHAHRLDDIQGDLEVTPIGATIVARLGDVLGPKAEDQFLADNGPITRLSVCWNGQRDRVRNTRQQPRTGLLQPAGDEVHRR